MVETDDTCPSTHTLRCTLARGHDGPHTAFRTRVSWTDDVDATARLREPALLQRLRIYMGASMAMPHFETDQEQNWIFGHMATFAGREVREALSPLRSTPQEDAHAECRWSLEQMNAQAGRVIAGDSPTNGMLKTFARFIVQECQSCLQKLR